MGTKRINDQSERQLSGRTPLNFLSNFASSHVMHVSSFAGQVQKIQSWAWGLFHLLEDAQTGQGALAQARPGRDSRDSSGPSAAAW